MNDQESRSLRGVLLDTEACFTITEVCRACGTDQSMVIKLVEEGVIETIDQSSEWRFHGEALIRARRAVRLIHDLDVNLPGAALALDLLDRLEQLETDRRSN